MYLNSWLPPWEILFSHRKGWPLKVGRLLAFEIPKPCRRHLKIAKPTRNTPPPAQVFLVISPTCIGYSLKIQSGANHHLAYPHTYIHTGVLHSEPKSTAPAPTFFFLPDADTPSLRQKLEVSPPAVCPEVATACSGI